ncbi:lectin subunit alpha [Musca domestica]|uniref:Lectin subunit alpha n=1 Tax=Musca domestica TaxID=7370 RepID=A0A1I8MNW2_MUSDO|nr:lectin subunit alpha [Musca domestica]
MRAVIVLCTLAALAWSSPIEKWHRSSDGCLYYVEHEMKFNWYQAWEECLNRNMTLITLDSFYKQQQIDGIIQMNYAKKLTFWMAAHDNAVDKRHTWATTGKILSFTNWAKDQPNYAANDHCLLTHDSTGQWHDFPCTSKLGFVCEILQCTNTKSGDLENGELSKELKKYNVNIWNLLGSHR